MLIKTNKPDTYLQFERTDTHEYLEVTVTACLGGFVVSTGTWFFGAEQFLSELSDFERTRQGTATLASDECRFHVRPCDSTGGAQIHFWVSHKILYYGIIVAGEPFPAGAVSMEADFHLNGEFIGQMLYDFTHLLRSQPGA
jgi:hypothetical protein